MLFADTLSLGAFPLEKHRKVDRDSKTNFFFFASVHTRQKKSKSESRSTFRFFSVECAHAQAVTPREHKRIAGMSPTDRAARNHVEDKQLTVGRPDVYLRARNCGL